MLWPRRRLQALWETLNNADNGIIKLVEATALGAYIFGGYANYYSAAATHIRVPLCFLLT